MALIFIVGLIGGSDGVRETDGNGVGATNPETAAAWWSAVRPAPAVRPARGLRIVRMVETRTPTVARDADNGSASGYQLAQSVVCTGAYPWSCEWALAAINCESTYRTDALGTEVIQGVRYWFHGWWQIISTSPKPGSLADSVYNTERAAEKYIDEGTGAWPRCP